MRRVWGSSFIALLFTATLVAPAGASQALSPGYVSSEPAHKEKVQEAPERVQVTFDEPLDASSDLTVTDECGRTVDDGNVEIQGNIMSVGIALKPSGAYQVTYFARGLGGVTGQESGMFGFQVATGPSCGEKKEGGGHQGHGGGDGKGGDGNGGEHEGGHGSGGGSTGHSGRSGSGGGTHGGMTDHGSVGHSSASKAHSAMGNAGSSPRHGSNKHGSGKHGKGGAGKHGKGGAHGLLDILDRNERSGDRPLAAGPGDDPAPDGQAVLIALGLSLLMGVVGGWLLRVSGAR